MKPNPKYLNNTTPEFWANVKLISQKLGYTQKGTKRIKIHSIETILDLYQKLNFKTNKIVFNDETTEFGKLLTDYFEYRAHALNDYVQHYLMDIEDARELYNELTGKYNYTVSIPMNKQRGEMATVNYFTGIINILLEANIGDYKINYSASELTAFTLKRDEELMDHSQAL